MKFLKRIVRAIYDWSEYEDDFVYINTDTPKHSSLLGGYHNENTNELNLTVFPAVGGRIIQVKSYNQATDKGRTSLYVITEQEDLGKELGLIITRESLSR